MEGGGRKGKIGVKGRGQSLISGTISANIHRTCYIANATNYAAAWLSGKGVGL